jgi:hypothetical protein
MKNEENPGVDIAKKSLVGNTPPLHDTCFLFKLATFLNVTNWYNLSTTVT